MIIGIDASRAFIKNRTGIEEYSYQVIKHLVNELKGHEVVLYLRKNSANYEFDADARMIDNVKLPANWKLKVIKWPRFWTQGGLSLEMLLNPVDVLFVPAHTVPFIHPENTAVTIHGLEYEFCSGAYSLWEKIYMRCSIKNSCRWAKTIITVSNNTRKDLVKLYGIDESKIKVIYEGCGSNDNLQTAGDKPNSNVKSRISNTEYRIPDTKYIFFVGRLEERKNIIGIVSAFEVLKEHYKIPHKLVLAGKPGYEYGKIKEAIANSNYTKEIVELGFVGGGEKKELLKNADVFVFPTFYEGFGLPILEAQSVGTSVVTSNVSSIPEVAGDSALLVDPNNAEEIADAIYKILTNEKTKEDIIQKGLENVKRFSWEKCAGEVRSILNIGN
ncbi:MAG: glycosyltransferase family 4 protein [Patescibacteria group bacterium]|jgi:glycosyltransferase involved in cell wall biosynthesis|nr:glycosyltransferase family 4 protein [Candidatus Moranbacteria bacterium]